MELFAKSWSAKKNFVGDGWFVRRSCTRQRFLGTSSCWSTSPLPFDGFLMATQFFFVTQRTKNSKTIDLNVTHIVLFNSPRDSEQFGVLGRQLEERHATMEAHKRATQKPFGHLMIDFDVRSSKSLRYSSNCSGDVPSIFYCSTDQLCLHLDNEFTKLLYNWLLYWLSCYTENMLHPELLWWNNHFFVIVSSTL